MTFGTTWNRDVVRHRQIENEWMKTVNNVHLLSNDHHSKQAMVVGEGKGVESLDLKLSL